MVERKEEKSNQAGRSSGDLIGDDKILDDEASEEKIDAGQTHADLVTGDKVEQVLQIDLPFLLEAWRQSLPEDSPAPAYLFDVLHQFKNYHAHVNDWIELHNQLNDILFNYGQFSHEVERLAVSHEDPEPRTIRMHWRPVAQKVAILLDWASVPRDIYNGKAFARLEDRIVGPLWAVELCVASDRLDDLMRPSEPPRLFVLPRDSRPNRAPYLDIGELYDASSEFYDIAERSIYLTGRQLHETATALVNLSRIVLGNLEGKSWMA